MRTSLSLDRPKGTPCVNKKKKKWPTYRQFSYARAVWVGQEGMKSLPTAVPGMAACLLACFPACLLVQVRSSCSSTTLSRKGQPPLFPLLVRSSFLAVALQSRWFASYAAPLPKRRTPPHALHIDNAAFGIKGARSCFRCARWASRSAVRVHSIR